MMKRIKLAFHVLMGDIDIDLMESSHRAQMDALNKYCENLEGKYDRKNDEIKNITEWGDQLESFSEITAPSSKAWGRVLRKLVWQKVEKVKHEDLADDEELISAMDDYCSPRPSRNALAQCISYLRNKKGYNIKRKNNRYTL